ncbi:MAG TPA: DUF4157 domain-containing protein [Acidimicrobiales bacterium]
MKLVRRPGYWLLVGGPVPPGAAAITIGSVISVRTASIDDARLLRHELVHVDQWRRLGFLRFSVQYLGSYLQSRLAGASHHDAYRRIPLEIEADLLSRSPAGSTEPTER